MTNKLHANSLLLLCRAGAKSRYFVTGLLGAYLSASAAHAQQKPDDADIRHKREQAALAARTGKLMDAIDQLEQLALQAPKDTGVKADLIVLLRQVGRNEQIRHLTSTLSVDAMPEYALIPWIEALLDTQSYGRAELLVLKLKQHLRHKPFVSLGLSEANLDIYLAMIRVDSGQKQAARRAINAISRQYLSADQYARIAYICRQLGDPLTCLSNTDIALSMQPDHRMALEQMVAALTDIGATTRAYDIARQFPDIFPLYTLQDLQAATTASRLRDAVVEYQRLSALGQQTQGVAVLEHASMELQQVLHNLPVSHPQHVRLSYDEIYALRMRERMPDVLTAFGRLQPEQQEQAPDYVRRVLADAYLALRQPQQALALYQQLLNENEQPDSELYTAAYYAYIEFENRHQTVPVLQRLQRELPAFAYSEPQAARVLPDWQQLDPGSLSSIEEPAYRPQLDKAAQQLAAYHTQGVNRRHLLAAVVALPRLADLIALPAHDEAIHPAVAVIPYHSLIPSHQQMPGWSPWLNAPWYYQLAYARRASDRPLRAVAIEQTAAYAFGPDQCQHDGCKAAFSYAVKLPLAG